MHDVSVGPMAPGRAVRSLHGPAKPPMTSGSLHSALQRGGPAHCSPTPWLRSCQRSSNRLPLAGARSRPMRLGRAAESTAPQGYLLVSASASIRGRRQYRSRPSGTVAVEPVEEWRHEAYTYVSVPLKAEGGDVECRLNGRARQGGSQSIGERNQGGQANVDGSRARSWAGSLRARPRSEPRR